MTEARRQTITAIVTFVLTSGGAWMMRSNDLDKISENRLTKIETIVSTNAVSVEALTKHVESLASICALVPRNSADIQQLTSQVQDIVRTVTRIETIVEEKGHKGGG